MLAAAAFILAIRQAIRPQPQKHSSILGMSRSEFIAQLMLGACTDPEIG
jgi:hypothetical protein